MGYRCKSCDGWHEERPTAFLAEMPGPAAKVPVEAREQRVVLGSDQCVIDGKLHFLLGNLDLRVCDSEEFIRWTVWSSLSAQNFRRASDLWTREGREGEPPYPGYLCNDIPGYPPVLGVALLLHSQPVGIRPRIELKSGVHPLYRDQREGISTERADELIHKALVGSKE